MNKKTQDTSWGKVAGWYKDHLEEDDTYHNKVVGPNLLRMMDVKPNDIVAELGCGEGFFTRQIAKLAKKTVGLDLGAELIALAEKKKAEAEIKNDLSYVVASADKTDLPDSFFDKVLIVLALQNMKDLNGVISEVSRILKKSGTAYIVLNHPNYRIIGQSSWQFDNEKKVQFRRIDSYMTESTNKIDMAPGSKKQEKITFSFHRPLQVYFKAFQKFDLSVIRLEEWISHKKSEKGTRQLAEDTARKEFPLFMALELRKN
jgi:ubiquinone/menaquinone biosynthesis C-methylase UbiE